MKKAELSNEELARISNWDRIWNDAMRNVIFDKMVAGEPTEITEDEDIMLQLIHERRLPSRVEGRAGGKGEV